MTTQEATGKVDQWAYAFFQDLLNERLSPHDFEQIVTDRWQSGGFILSAPETANYFADLAETMDSESEVSYACSDLTLDFESHWLVGKPDSPGAVYIKAPAEKEKHPALSDLNRPVHLHDTGRINLITSGEAVFLFLSMCNENQYAVVSCPVSKGDIIFWPAWTPHTFNALNGFSVLSSMPCYVSPEEDGYTIEYPHHLEHPDKLALITMSDYQAQLG